MATRREHTSTESRELILTAAAELFAAKGYRQTTFADVAERSGISRGSIPWHFGSKEGLLLAVLERSVDLVHASLDDAPDPDARTGLDRMTKGLDALFAQPTTKLLVTLLVEALEPDSPIRERYVAIQDTLRGHCTVSYTHRREVPSRTDWWGMLVRVDLSQLAQALDATSRLNAEFTLQSGR